MMDVVEWRPSVVPPLRLNLLRIWSIKVNYLNYLSVQEVGRRLCFGGQVRG